MDKPYVISINAISGGGKTTLTKLVAKSLKNSKAFHFDEFDSTNIYPENFYDWSIRGANIEEFDCPGMQEAIAESISDNIVDYIVIDFPFGRDHSRLKRDIDLSVFIDTPLDVAMARRIIRDFIEDASDTADSRLKRLKEDLSYYISKARYPYLDTYQHKDNCDLILDGWKNQEEICEEILKKLRQNQTEQGNPITIPKNPKNRPDEEPHWRVACPPRYRRECPISYLQSQNRTLNEYFIETSLKSITV